MVSSEGFSLFAVNIELTAAGLENWWAVAEIVYSYVQMLQAGGAQEWVYEELQKQAVSDFRFKSKGEAINESIGIAKGLHYYPAEDVLTGPNLFCEFDAELIDAYIKAFTVGNSRIRVEAKELEEGCDVTEEHYGIKYSIVPFTEVSESRVLLAMIVAATSVKRGCSCSGCRAVVGGGYNKKKAYQHTSIEHTSIPG